MKAAIISWIAVCFLSTLSFGQNADSQILRHSKNNHTFIYNDRVIKLKELPAVTRLNPMAYNQIVLAKQKYDFSYALESVAGFLIGWDLGTVISGGKPSWTLSKVGGGLILLSIPFKIGYGKRINRGIHLFNSGGLPDDKPEISEFQFLYNDRFGLVFTF